MGMSVIFSFPTSLSLQVANSANQAASTTGQAAQEWKGATKQAAQSAQVGSTDMTHV